MTELLESLLSNSPSAALIILAGWLMIQKLRDQEMKSEQARSDIKKILYDVKDMTKDLHEWHNVTNPDGSRPWMNAGLERVIKELSDNVKEQTKVMRNIISKLESIANKVNV